MKGLIDMKKYTLLSCMVVAVIGISLASGCVSDISSTNSKPAASEDEETEYCTDLTLTLTYPDKTEYTSNDNGVTWSTNGKTVCYNELPAYLTVIHQDVISISGGIPITMTIHNNSNDIDHLNGGSYVDVLRFDDGNWTIPEYADKSKNYAFTSQIDLIHLAKDYYIDLSIYEPVSGRYKLTKEFSIESDSASPGVPYGKYTMSAEFNADP